MDSEAQRAMMLRIVGAYVELSLFTAQRQLLTSRNPQQWMTDKAFGSIIQNVPQYVAVANAPAPQMQPFSMNQAQQVLGQLSTQVPQQGQVTQPPPPPPPGHYDWDQATQAYVWVPNP